MRSRLRRNALWLCACLSATFIGIWMSEHGSPEGIYGLTMPAMMVMLFLVMPKASMAVPVDMDDEQDTDGPDHEQVSRKQG